MYLHLNLPLNLGTSPCTLCNGLFANLFNTRRLVSPPNNPTRGQLFELTESPVNQENLAPPLLLLPPQSITNNIASSGPRNLAAGELQDFVIKLTAPEIMSFTGFEAIKEGHS